MAKLIKYKDKTLEYYSYYKTETSCIFSFFNIDYNSILDFFGNNIIDNITLTDDALNKTTTIPLDMKFYSIQSETSSIILKTHSVIKESYYTEEALVDPETGKPVLDESGHQIIETIFHPAEIKTSESKQSGILITVQLEKPSLNDRITVLTEDVQKQSQVSALLAQTLNDSVALSVKDIYEQWNDLVKKNFVAKDKDYKFLYNSDLYKTAKENVEFQSQWIPGQNTESLFTYIDEDHIGTLEDPIPAKVNMEYFKDKYYIENNNLYLCISELAKNGIVLQYTPSQLVGSYFELIELR